MKYGLKTNIENFKMIKHISYDNEHKRVDIGKIDCKEHHLHGKVVVRNTFTPVASISNGRKQFGLPDYYWFLEEYPDKFFKNIMKFAKYYKLP